MNDPETYGRAEQLPDGNLFMILTGNLDVETLGTVLSHLNELITEAKQQGRPANIVVDATRLESIRLDSRKHGVEWLKEAQYDKVAVFGESMFMKYFVNMLIRALRCNMRYFTDRTDAENWLKERDEEQRQ